MPAAGRHVNRAVPTGAAHTGPGPPGTVRLPFPTPEGTVIAMPNWCNNELVVRGPHTAIEDFLGTNGTQPLSMNAFLPHPRYNDRDDVQAAHSWRVTTWGTKWELDENVEPHRVCTGELRYTFCTAWSPPVPFVAHLSNRFPLLEFVLSFAESGNDFCGQIGWRAGSRFRDASARWEAIAIPVTDDPDDDGDGDDDDPDPDDDRCGDEVDLYSPDDLHEACLALADDDAAGRVLHQIEERSSACLPRPELEQMLELFPTVSSYPLAARLAAQPLLRPDDVVRVVSHCTQTGGSGECVDAFACCGHPFVAPLARALRLITPMLVAPFGVQTRYHQQRDELFARLVERVTDAHADGLAEDYVTALGVLLDDWQGDAAQLIEGSWRLVAGR